MLWDFSPCWISPFQRSLEKWRPKVVVISWAVISYVECCVTTNKFHSQMFYLSHTNTTILTFICNCTRKMIITILTFGELDVVRLFSLLEVLKKSREVANESCCYFMSRYFIRWMLCYNQTSFILRWFIFLVQIQPSLHLFVVVREK